ncbi:MAG: hypothetical protein U0903_19970 [Planctomycetales bacterium]
MSVRLTLACFGLLILACSGGSVRAAEPATPAVAAPASAKPAAPNFSREIRVILAEKCMSCHSGEKPKGGWSLADKSLAFAPDSEESRGLSPASRMRVN